MVQTDVIDFLMEELAQPTTCPGKIRQTIKQLAGMGASIGRRMLTDQLIDSLFELYIHGLADSVELGMALKAKLNRHVHARFMPVRHPGVILPWRRATKASVPTRIIRHLT